MSALRPACKPPKRSRSHPCRSAPRRWRKLVLEPLEERQLLTVNFLAAEPASALLTAVKSLKTTSEPITAGADVTIGEVIRYRLQVGIPEGTFENLRLVDLLPAGLQFLDDNTAMLALVADDPLNISSTALSGEGLSVVGNEWNVASITPTFTLPGTAISPDVFASGTDPIFSLGTIVNSESDANSEFVVLEFNALVKNNTDANKSDVKSSRFEVQTGATPATLATSNSVDVTICEPVITQSKQLLSPRPWDADDLARYRVVLTNNGDATAFETSLLDILPGDLALNPASVTITTSGGVVGTINASDGNTVHVTLDAILPGGSVTVTYNATVKRSIGLGQTVQNTALVTYTSLRGTHGMTSNPTGSVTPGAPGQPTGERTGSGIGPNDYRISRGVSFTTALPMASQSIVATSEPSTSGSNVAVGEIIRYRLKVWLPEGTVENLRLTGQLPNGLRFLDDGTAKVMFIADNVTRISSSTLAGPGLVVAGNDANIDRITPTFVLPETALLGGPFVTGADPVFSLGTVTNFDDDLSTEFIVLEFNALVCNDVFTFNERTLSSRFLVQSGTATLATSQAVPVVVREPILTATKTIDADAPRQAGKQVNYRVTFGNPGGTTGFEARLFDALPSEVALDLSSVQIQLDGGASGVTNASAGNTVDVTIATIPAGGNVTVIFTGLMLADVTPDETIRNTAILNYTSLPGNNGTTVNPTGSLTPGEPGTPDGERTGEGGVNKYLVTAEASLLVADLQVTNTNNADSVVPGERVTYTIVVINAGPSDVAGATVTDEFPAILKDVTYTSTVTGTASGNTAAGQGNINDTVNMVAGSTITYTASGTLILSASGPLINVARVALPPGVHALHPEKTEAEDSDPVQQLIVISPDEGDGGKPWIHLVTRRMGALVARFPAFDESYRGGVRVTTGDLTGDGIPEIVAVRGQDSTPEVRIFDLRGNLLLEIPVFPESFDGGVQIAVGDVDGDGRNDLIAAMGSRGSQVVVFRNEMLGSNLAFQEAKRFHPFGSGFQGGVVVAAADMGEWGGSLFHSNLDGKAEIVVGSGPGMNPTVRVIDYATLRAVRTFYPFDSAFQGGLSLDVARVNQDEIPDLIIGAGPGGGSKVEVLDGAQAPKKTLLSFVAYPAVESSSYDAPVHVAAVDDNRNGFADLIVTAQGSDGTTGIIKSFRASAPSQLAGQFDANQLVPADFDSAYFVADFGTARAADQGGVSAPPFVPLSWTNPALAEDVNADGIVTALDALLLINDLNVHGARALTGVPSGSYFPDVDASESVEPADVLRVIQYLSAPRPAFGGEGEGIAVSSQSAARQQDLDSFAFALPDTHPTGSIPSRMDDNLPSRTGGFSVVRPKHYDAAPPGNGNSVDKRSVKTAASQPWNTWEDETGDDDLAVIAEDVSRAWDRDEF